MKKVTHKMRTYDTICPYSLLLSHLCQNNWKSYNVTPRLVSTQCLICSGIKRTGYNQGPENIKITLENFLFEKEVGSQTSNMRYICITLPSYKLYLNNLMDGLDRTGSLTPSSLLMGEMPGDTRAHDIGWPAK